MGFGAKRLEEPYAVACAWLAASARIRPAWSRSRVHYARRIRALGDTWGMRLDGLGASQEQVRWCAAPPDVADRERRYRALAHLLETRPGDRGAWTALRANMPKTGRWKEADGAGRSR